MGIVSAWILGGLGVLGGVIVALINLLGGSPTVVVNINSTRQDNSAVSAATSSSAAAKATPSVGTPAVVFRDNFCTTAGGWTLGTGRAGGQYSTCALRIYANGNDVQSSEPTNAGSLPQDITIDVTARRILGSAAGDEFGIACRAGNAEGYTFIVQASSVSIYRYSSKTGIIGRRPLAHVPAQVDMNASNRLRAACATVGGAADLTLWVNNSKLADATDTSDPLTSGTVGLFAATTSDTSTSTGAEFTNFVVTRELSMAKLRSPSVTTTFA